MSSEEPEKKQAAQNAVMMEVQARFPPEFLNRLSAIVMFNSLGITQLETIVQKSMEGIRKRLAPQGIGVILESSGARAILLASYNPDYGARPVERYLESTVVTTLSRMLISGELVSGSIVSIEAIEDGEDDSCDDVSVPVQKKARLRYKVEAQDVTNIEDDEDPERLLKWETMEE
jgi:ATP-dependent Clp protease ATP-binding subunit ClpB